MTCAAKTLLKKCVNTKQSWADFSWGDSLRSSAPLGSSAPPLVQPHIVAITLITQREKMREMGVSDALHYACMDPRRFVVIDDPLTLGSEWGSVAELRQTPRKAIQE